ncbi:hypothetical protein FEM03_13525 [Phragmitibacter flavus]|uniref:Uncharacterized protein n=1 Tax=Phragmitibacter flavus TaxID=2576071 RepID=A0A5R8KE41_9BACT|nr:hypothetical protein [Phragmitibacter flavus]TLD70205.1 hypothetical protein FEM03_13525 [Phragmitibacter flavus]
MKTIQRKMMKAILSTLLPSWDETDGWTYNHFFGTPHLRLGESADGATALITVILMGRQVETGICN